MIALPSFIDRPTLDCEEIAQELIGESTASTRFRLHLVEFLKEAYGIAQSQLTPDIKCFVNAQANTYSYQGQGEINNICGAIQLAPGRTGKKDGKRITVEKTPDCVNVNFDQTELLYDSCAFTDVLTGDRVTPEAALQRQLDTLQGLPVVPPEVWLVSYDRLIDEKHVEGTRIKERWSVDDGELAVTQTVEAAKYLSSQRHRLEGYKLVMSCQGVDAAQYQRCVEQVLEVCQPDDVLGLGGWCILGKQKRWLPVFWEVCDRVIPIIASSGIQQVHIFGCTWYRPMQGFPISPLSRLLEACDKHGLSLSVDGRSPISNALWKNWKQAGAAFPYWRHNLAWVKAELATLRDSIQSTSTVSCKGFKVGDRIVENGNNPAWGCTLDSLIRHGEIIDFRHVPGCPQEEKHPFVRYDDGSEGFVIWEQMHPDTLKIPTTPPWKDESAEALLEVAKALSSPCTGKVVDWVITAEEELNKIQQQIDKCCLGQDKAKGELKKALKDGQEVAEKEFIDAIVKYSNEAAALGLAFSFQSYPEGERNHHETRSKSGAIGKDYRGWIAVASTANPKQPDWDIIKQVARIAGDEATKNRLRRFDLYEPGHILALARVSDAFEMTAENIAVQPPLELATGDWQPGRWAFKLEDAIALGGRAGAIALPQPIPYTAKGQGAPYLEPGSELGQQLLNIIKTFKCSSLTNSSGELADSVRPQNSPEDSPSETTSILTPTPKPSTEAITQVLPSTETLEPIIPNPEPIYTARDFLARAHQAREVALDSITPNPVFGLKPCDASSKGIQTLWSLKTLKVLSTEDYGKFLEDSEWLDIRGALRNSYRQLGSELLTGETDSSLLPTPTSYAEGSGTHRPAGTNKLERKLKLLPTPIAKDGESRPGNQFQEYSLNREITAHIQDSEKINPAVPGWMMGFQPGYVEKILMVGGDITQPQFTQASPPEQKDAEPASSSTAEASCPSKLRSHSAESSTSTQSLENEIMVQSAERETTERRWHVGDTLVGADKTGIITEATKKEVHIEWTNSKGGVCGETYPRKQLKYLSEFKYCEQTQPTEDNDQEPKELDWEAYGYTWKFSDFGDEAIIQCKELFWELDPVIFYVKDPEGKDEDYQIPFNGSPQEWLDDWMHKFPDRWKNILFSNEQSASPAEAQFCVGDRCSALSPIPFGFLPQHRAEVGDMGTVVKSSENELTITWDVGETTYQVDSAFVAWHSPIEWKEGDRFWAVEPKKQGTVQEDLGEGVYRVLMDGSKDPILTDREKIYPLNRQSQEEGLDRYLEKRINAEGEDSEERLEYINPSSIDLEKGSQTRTNKNEKGIKDFLEKMEAGVWRFDDANDCPKIIELTANYLVRVKGQEPFWVKAGERIPAIGHTRLEAAQRLQALKPNLTILARIKKGTWFDVIRESGTSDVNSAHPKSTSDRTNACYRFIELLFERYGSIENIPKRGRGQTGADLEEEWGNATLGRMYGLSINTVQKLYLEVDFNRQIEDYPDGTRVQLVAHPDFELPWYLKNMVGALGIASGSAPKEGVFVSFDQHNPEYVHPRFLQKSDAPIPVVKTKPQEAVLTHTLTGLEDAISPGTKPHSSTNSELKEQARSLGVSTGSQVLPDATTNLDVPPDEAQTEPPTPSPINQKEEEETKVPPPQQDVTITPTTPGEWTPELYQWFEVTEGHHAGKMGQITCFPYPHSRATAIIELKEEVDGKRVRDRIETKFLQPITVEEEPQVISTADILQELTIGVKNLSPRELSQVLANAEPTEAHKQAVKEALFKEADTAIGDDQKPLYPVQDKLVDLVVSVRTVVDNLHLLKPEELAALEDAIAQAKRSWSESEAA